MPSPGWRSNHLPTSCRRWTLADASPSKLSRRRRAPTRAGQSSGASRSPAASRSAFRARCRQAMTSSPSGSARMAAGSLSSLLAAVVRQASRWFRHQVERRAPSPATAQQRAKRFPERCPHRSQLALRWLRSPSTLPPRRLLRRIQRPGCERWRSERSCCPVAGAHVALLRRLAAGGDLHRQRQRSAFPETSGALKIFSSRPVRS